ncbi:MULTISPECIES: glycoside hydrolase family 88 protein [unclassified Duganella]|uniref:glycoside hydrolase family 88 protein n=1 Tax=unclassified Duganella TaxID=2636909 RepID=UPI0013149C1E|nr:MULTISPECIES: glycoside hydrolase family 88 protein [unclassified Duganella]
MSRSLLAPFPLASLCASLCLLGVAGTALPPAAAASVAVQPAVPAPQAVLAMMERVADWQLAHPTTYPADDWTEGVGDAGFMALSGISGQRKYRDAMQARGEQAGWKLGPSRYHADDQVVGQTYAELYLQVRDPRMLAPMRSQFDAVLAEPREGTLDFLVPGVLHRWSWCDALFMGPPTWARLSAATGDPRYLEFAISHWWKTSDYLYDQSEHLYFRDSRYFQQREANGKKVFWGRGNGWVMGGLARMLQYIPDNHPERPRFVAQFRDMAERIAGLQQADGLWRASLLDPGSYPNRETSGTALYTYALAWGVNQGLLPRAVYGPVAQRAWQALSSHVEADGRLVHVQPIGQDPKHFDPASTDVFAVGGFLLAGGEIYRMGLEQGGVRQVAVANPGPLRRQEESLEVPGAGADMALVDSLTARVLPVQATERGLLFQADLAPGETRRYLLLPRSRLAAQPPVDARAHARFVPERMDDFAWESDRTAHRVYGPAIMTDPREMLVSSGVDVWSKSAHRLVLDEWYRRGDYHLDRGEGLDFYHVGQTRGCGGLGIYDGQRLHVSRNYSSWKVLADGPLRAVFELRYPAWDAAGRQVEETRRVSIDAGSNFSRIESRFASPGAAPLMVGVGMVRRDGAGQYREDRRGWMSYWEPQHGADGNAACAIVLPGATGFVAQQGQYLALAAATPGQPLVYYLGAGWSKSGDFPDAAAWEAYVANRAARLAAPLAVSVSP